MALTDDQAEELSTILSTLGEARAKLPSKSRVFLDQMIEAYDKHGANTRVSPKQWAWLRNLLEEHG